MAKSKKTRPGADGPVRSAGDLLHRALKLSTDYYTRENGSGLTQRQLAVLAATRRLGAPTQTELVSETGIDRSTMAEMVARMAMKGLITRTRSSKDARSNVVTLSPAGEAALSEAEPNAVNADARLLKLIQGKRRREQFMALLTDLVEAGEGKRGRNGEPDQTSKTERPDP